MEQLNYFHIEITGNCNLKCLYCYNSKFNSSNSKSFKELSYDEIKNIINIAEQKGVKSIALSGGEPLIHKNIKEIIQYIDKKKGMRVCIFSNGLLLDEKMIDFLEKTKCITELRISYDGQANSFHRGNNGLKIKKIFSLLKDSKIKIGLNTILTKNSLLVLDDLYTFVKQNNIKLWRIDVPFKNGDYIENEVLLTTNRKELEIIYERTSKIIKKYVKERPNFAIETMMGFRSEMLSKNTIMLSSVFSHPCEYQKGTVTIKPDYSVSFCPSFPFSFGSLKTSSFDKIIESPSRKKFLELKIKDIEKCSICKYVKLCGGGCRADSYYEHKDFYSDDTPACLHFELFEKYILPVYPVNFKNAILEIINKV